MPRRRELTREELEAALAANPEVRLDDLKAIFRCGSGTIQRELRRHGLRTKSASEREKPWLQGDRSTLRQWHKQHPEFAERQRGDANPIHRVKHLYKDPAYVERITRGLRAHAASKLNRTYEEVYGADKAREYKDKLRKASPQRLAAFNRRETHIEAWVRTLLERLGVPFSAQVPVGDFTVDFLIPSCRLVIQADGDYWHGNPAVYPNPTARQRQRRGLDILADVQASSLGFFVLRLWESDIKRHPTQCEQIITERIYERQ